MAEAIGERGFELQVWARRPASPSAAAGCAVLYNRRQP
jgi:hypothetical protein